VLLEIARWPVVLFALVNVLLRVRWPYMVTPKGAGMRQGPRSLSLYGPYIALTALPLAAVWAFEATTGGHAIRGYFGLALANTAIGLVLLATTVGLEVRERARELGSVRAAVRAREGTLIVTFGLGVLLAYSSAALWAPIVQSLS
jgi:cellulose synthase (UDP-forming)